MLISLEVMDAFTNTNAWSLSRRLLISSPDPVEPLPTSSLRFRLLTALVMEVGLHRVPPTLTCLFLPALLPSVISRSAESMLTSST